MRCHAHRVAERAPDVSRKVNYFFVDFHSGNYEVEIVGDPSRPELLTTDLGLDKITNRIVTLVVAGPLFLLLGLGALWSAQHRVRRQRTIVRALSNQVLRPVLLRMDGYALGHWAVSQPPASSPIVWTVPKRARPILIDPALKAVLGVTAGDGRVAMPLDAALTWIDLTDEERRYVVAPLRPDQLEGELTALDTGELQTSSTRCRARSTTTRRSTSFGSITRSRRSSSGAWPRACGCPTR